jgi:hypothetical protein
MTIAPRAAEPEIDDEDEADAAFEVGLEIGGLNAEIAEARRLLAIFESGEAALRPFAAWSLLPLGLSVSETRRRLAQYPREECSDELYVQHHNFLRERLARARATAEKENPNVTQH